MNNPLLAIQSQYWAVRDYLSPVLKESKFKEHGRLTPEEFVAAGDFLVYKFPVWNWQKGEPGKSRDFLPPDKQYLVTRNVPCLRRATALEYGDSEEDGERLLNFLDEAEEAPGPDGKTRSKAVVPDDEDAWVETHVGRTSHQTKSAAALAEIPDMDDDDENIPTDTAATSSTSRPTHNEPHLGDLTADILNKLDLEHDAIPDIDDIPDMDDEDDAVGGEAVMLEDEEEDEAAAKGPTLNHPSARDVEQSRTRENLLQVRTYDCFISYDKHYQTPRFWLLGYDENKQPLTPTQVFQDVPSDHAFKTMTMETFPHSGQLLASVHPCKHASVMKKFIDRMDDARKNNSSSASSAAQEDATAPTSADKSDKKKKGWGIGGVVRKVTGGSSGSGSTTSSSAPVAGNGTSTNKQEDLGGVQVDFYMIIFLKFIASIVPTIEVDNTTAF